MTRFAFIDIETTGTDPAEHAIWEIAAIVGDQEHSWRVPLTEEEMAKMTPYVRRNKWRPLEPIEAWVLEMDPSLGLPSKEQVAAEFFDAVHGTVPVAVRVTFDLFFLRAFISRHHWRPNRLIWEDHTVRVPVNWLHAHPQGEKEPPEDWPCWEDRPLRTGRPAVEGEVPDPFPVQPYHGEIRWEQGPSIGDSLLGLQPPQDSLYVAASSGHHSTVSRMNRRARPVALVLLRPSPTMPVPSNRIPGMGLFTANGRLLSPSCRRWRV